MSWLAHCALPSLHSRQSRDMPPRSQAVPPEDRVPTEEDQPCPREPGGGHVTATYDPQELELRLLLTYLGRPSETEPLFPDQGMSFEGPAGARPREPIGSGPVPRGDLDGVRTPEVGPVTQHHVEALHHLFMRGCDAEPDQARESGGNAADAVKSGGQGPGVLRGVGSLTGRSSISGGTTSPPRERGWVSSAGPAAPALLHLLDHQPGLAMALVRNVAKCALFARFPRSWLLVTQ